MNYFEKIRRILLILSLSLLIIPISFSSQGYSNQICCFSFDSQSVYSGFNIGGEYFCGSSNSGEEDIAFNKPEGLSCDEAFKPVFCQINNGPSTSTCSDSISGNRFYLFDQNNDGIFNGGELNSADGNNFYDLFREVYNIDYVCDELKTSCNTQTTNILLDEESGEEISIVNEEDSVINSPEYQIPEELELENNFPYVGGIDNGYSEVCKLQTGLFGLFSNKDRCNQFEDSGENPCLYNPEKASNIFSNEKSLNLFSLVSDFERSSCIPKNKIISCYDYKTEENCQGNLAFSLDGELSSKDLSLKNGCRWIEGNSFGSNFSATKGICVPKGNENAPENFNEMYYSDRMNLIENPSFEDSQQNSQNNLNIVNAFAYHGENSLELDPNNVFSIEIENLSIGSYMFSFATRKLDISNNFSFSVRYRFKKEDGSFIQNWVELPIATNSQINQKIDSSEINPFVTLYFGPIIHSAFQNGEFLNQRLNDSILEIELSSEIAVLIDALNLEKITSGSKSYFSPVQIINPKASSCQLCFDPLNPNSCTKEKSDKLGDCSYMVENSSKPYLFNASNALAYNLSTNPYLSKLDYSSSEISDNRWSSQSIANGNLFCELYTREDNCKSSENFVNSKYSNLHKIVSNNKNYNNLCNWDQTIGCYKDSNSDQVPDNLEDYRLSCDQIPPVVYFYFYGRNNSGDINEIDMSQTNPFEDYGDIKLYYSITDNGLESFPCKKFESLSEEQNRIYLNISDANQNSIEYELGAFENNFENNQLKKYGVVSFKDLLKDIDFDLSTLNIVVRDQSNNYGYGSSLNLNGVDFLPPEIILTNKQSSSNGVVEIDNQLVELFSIVDSNNQPIKISLSNEEFLFEINDQSSIKACQAKVDGYGNLTKIYDSSNNVPPTSFNFNLTDIVNESLVDPFGEEITLEVSCFDSFNQKKTNAYSLFIDFNLEFNLISPFPLNNVVVEGNYTYNDLNFGFLNGSTEIIANSTEIIDECELSGDGFIGENMIGTPLPDGEGTNLSGIIDFNSQGIKNLTITCTDESGGSFSTTYYYDFDKTTPRLLDWNLISEKTAEYNGKKYVLVTSGNSREIPYINLSLDGTFSWINSQNISYGPEGLKSTLQVSSEYDFNTSDSDRYDFISNHIFQIPTQTPGAELIGFEDLGNNLTKISFNLTIQDMSGNLLDTELEFYNDLSELDFKFSGDIITSTNGILYTRNSAPNNIIVGLNSPPYRTFNCSSVKLVGGGRTFSYSLGQLSRVQRISLTSLLPSIDLSQEQYQLSLTCSDLFGIEISKSYQLKFDDTPLKLDDITFKDEKKVFYRNLISENQEISPVSEEELNLIFEDTNEEFVDCDYKFIPYSPNRFQCDPNSQNSKYYNPDGIIRLTEDQINLIEFSNNNNDFICGLTQNEINFKRDTLNLMNSNSGEYSYKFKAYSLCRDAVGFSSNIERDFDVVFTDSSLVDLEFDYEDVDGEIYAFPKIYSLFKLDGRNFIFNELVNNGLSMNLESNQEIPDGNLFLYTFNEGIPLKDLVGNGNTDVKIIHTNSNSEILGKIIVDKIKPKIERFELDRLNNNRYLYYDRSDLIVKVSDNLNDLSNLSILIKKGESEVWTEIYNFNRGVLETENSNLDFTKSNKKDFSFPVEFDFSDPDNYGDYQLMIVVEDFVGNLNQKTIDFFVTPFRVVLKGTSQKPIFANPLIPNQFFIASEPNQEIKLDIIPEDKSISCSKLIVSGVDSTGPSQTQYTFNNNQITDGFVLASDLYSNLGIVYDSIAFDYKCSSEGIPKEGILYLIKDSTGITIENLSLFERTNSGEFRERLFFNFLNNPNAVFNDKVAKLRVNIAEENKNYYNCQISGENIEIYDYSDRVIKIEDTTNQLENSPETILGFEGFYSWNQVKLNNFLDGQTNKESPLKFNVICSDALGNEDSKSFDFNVNYLKAGIVQINYLQESASLGKIEVLSTKIPGFSENTRENYKIVIRNQNGDMIYEYTPQEVQEESGLFIYSEESMFDISNLNKGDILTISVEKEGIELPEFKIEDIVGFDLSSPEIIMDSSKTSFSNSIEFRMRIKDESQLNELSILEDGETILNNININNLLNGQTINNGKIELRMLSGSQNEIEINVLYKGLDNGENIVELEVSDIFDHTSSKTISLFKKIFEISLYGEIEETTNENRFTTDKTSPQIGINITPQGSYSCNSYLNFKGRNYELGSTINQLLTLPENIQFSNRGDSFTIEVYCDKETSPRFEKMNSFKISYLEENIVEGKKFKLYDFGYPSIEILGDQVDKEGIIFEDSKTSTIKIKSKTSPIRNLSIYLNGELLESKVFNNNILEYDSEIKIKEGLLYIRAELKDGKSSEFRKNYFYPNGIFYLLDGEGLFSDNSNMAWIINSSKPKLSFRLLRGDNARCYLEGYEDNQFYRVDGDERRLILDTSLIEEFDAEELDSLNIRCNNRDYRIDLFKLDNDLIDFSINEEDNFVIGEDGVTILLNRIVSPEPFEAGSCTIIDSNNKLALIDGNFKNSFSWAFTNQSKNEFIGICRDRAYREHFSSYNTIKNNYELIELLNSTLKLGYFKKDITDSDQITIREGMKYDLEFKFNKENLDCRLEYRKLEEDSIFSSIINFFKKIFTSREKLELNGIQSIYNINEFELVEGSYDSSLICSSGELEYRKDFIIDSVNNLSYGEIRLQLV